MVKSGIASKAVYYYVKTAVWVIVISGLAKLIAASLENLLLTKHDPVFDFLSYRQVALVVGMVEVAAAFFIIQRRHLAMHVLCWLSTMFLLYRIGLWGVGSKEPCQCLGNLLGWAGISNSVERGLTTLLFVFLLVCSYCCFLIRMIDSERENEAISDTRP
jgi:hypothetical protein